MGLTPATSDARVLGMMESLISNPVSRAAMSGLRSFVRENPRVRAATERAIKAVSAQIAESPMARGMYYEAARHTRRTAGWFAPDGGSNLQIRDSLPDLRRRARYQDRNDSLSHRYIITMTQDIVGSGARPYATSEDAELNRAANAIWSSESGGMCLDGSPGGAAKLQWMAMYAAIQAGESAMLRHPVEDASLLSPVKMQVVESEYIDLAKNQAQTDKQAAIVNGVQFDSAGKISGYWMFDYVDESGFSPIIGSHFVPASDVAHLFLPSRPGQVRGVPWLTPVMLAMRDLDNWRDAERVRKTTESALCAFIIGGADDEPAFQDVPRADRAGALSRSGGAWQAVEKLGPGMIMYVPEGRDIKFNAPASVDNYREYVSTELQTISAGLLSTYAEFTGDLSDTNYSSIQYGAQTKRRFVRSFRELFFVPLICQRQWDWKMEEAYIRRALPTPHVPCRWAFDPFISTDPTKDAEAAQIRLTSGLDTLKSIITESGRDWEEYLRELAECRDDLQNKAGITFPWMNSAPSNPTTPNPQEPAHANAN